MQQFILKSEPQKMSLVNVQIDDFLEELIQSLVTVRHYQSSLVGEVVVNVVYHLYRHVSLPCT